MSTYPSSSAPILPPYGRAPVNPPNLLKDREEDIGIVIRIDPLQDADVRRSNPIPVSTCCAGRGLERPVGLAVELDEDVVPDLDDVGHGRR